MNDIEQTEQRMQELICFHESVKTAAPNLELLFFIMRL